MIRSWSGRKRRHHVTCALGLSIFNVFDTVNFSGFFNFGASGVRPDEQGTLAFQPTVAGPPRQFQFSARVLF